MLVSVESQVALGFAVFVAQDAVSRGELGHDQTAAAEVANEAAEDSIRNTGHGREDGGRGNGHAAQDD